jgi:hypothetical protein
MIVLSVCLLFTGCGGGTDKKDAMEEPFFRRMYQEGLADLLQALSKGKTISFEVYDRDFASRYNSCMNKVSKKYGYRDFEEVCQAAAEAFGRERSIQMVDTMLTAFLERHVEGYGKGKE